MGFEATAMVVPNGNRKIRVLVPVVARASDGQVQYEGVAEAEFIIGAGSPVPRFSVDVKVTSEEVFDGR